MERFEKRLSKAPYEEKALDDWDRSVLEKGIVGLIPKLFGDFGKKLPEVIILPDTSARPLYYALAPSLDRIAQEYNLAKPRFYFFKSDRTYPVVQYIEMARGGLSDRSAVTEEEIRRAIPNVSDEDARHVAADAAQMPARRLLMKERAAEILQRESRPDGSRPTMAVIDEFVSRRASTATELRHAFDMPDLPVYGIFSMGTERAAYGHQLPSGPDEHPRAGLSYSGTAGVGVYKDTGTKNRYATPVPGTYEHLARDKGMLRGEMSELGNAVADRVMEEIGKLD